MQIPEYVKNIIEKLEKAGFEAYIVGGCVRDLLLGKIPKDWDVTTNAKPEEILKVFLNSKYENKFGTVLVRVKNRKGETENVVEVTTYRSEHGYRDHRHPDEVVFEKDLDKDLARRDFTINALAMKDVDSKMAVSKNLTNFKFQILVPSGVEGSNFKFHKKSFVSLVCISILASHLKRTVLYILI